MIDWQVSAEGAVFGSAFVDGAGDAVNTMTVQGPVERIAILVEGTVETRDTAGMLQGPPGDRSRPGSICSPPAPIEPSRGLIELKDAAVKGVEADRPLERSHRLAAAVADAIAYAPGATGRPHHRRRGAGAGQGRLPGSRPRA